MAIPLAELLPHRPPMLWLNGLDECTATNASATACFNPGDLAVADGRVLETALIECVAQTVAAALGRRAQSGGKAPAGEQGMLVSVSDFKIKSRPPAGSQLHIEVRELKRLGSLLRIAGTIQCGGEIVASGELTLYA